MGHTRNCGLVVRARGRPPVQEVISPKFRSTSSKATRAYRPRGLPFFRNRVSGLALPINQLSRLDRSCSGLGKLVTERMNRSLRPHHLHLRLIQLLGCQEMGGISLLCFLNVGIVHTVEIAAKIDSE